MDVISRAVAKTNGLKRYFTGEPCKYGHTAERLVSSGACSECMAIRDRAYKAANRDVLRERSKARNALSKEYFREYYLLNKDAYKARSDRRYREKRDEILAKQKAAALSNPDSSRSRAKKYREKNGEKVSQIMRSNYVRNRDAILEKNRIRYKKSPHKATAKVALRRARNRQAVPPWFGELDEFVWREAAHLVILRRKATRIDWASDHMIPIACKKACGLHVWNNCQVIPAYLNGWKNNKLVLADPFEWLFHLCKYPGNQKSLF